ncbi:DUF6153 family protein [Microbacterium sp.]|uniref:DUF6153 family protein n=1 Tax=Microbacterium sp. TaxID=51671 RepID=UPI0025DF8395|nr:DUF6153 family protein [Microbacterium sp.]
MRVRLIQRSEQPSASPRWLLAALFAALVIAGLLGMHTLSTGHSDSRVAAISMGTISMGTASIGTASMDADHGHAAPGPMEADADSGCLDCGTSDSPHAMMMACVLGLLVTLLLVCRTGPGLVRARGPSIVAPFLRAAISLRPRPPSLTVLSISRT